MKDWLMHVDILYHSTLLTSVYRSSLASIFIPFYIIVLAEIPGVARD
jgi:hypothetical protein